MISRRFEDPSHYPEAALDLLYVRPADENPPQIIVSAEEAAVLDVGGISGDVYSEDLPECTFDDLISVSNNGPVLLSRFDYDKLKEWQKTAPPRKEDAEPSAVPSAYQSAVEADRELEAMDTEKAEEAVMDKVSAALTSSDAFSEETGKAALKREHRMSAQEVLSEEQEEDQRHARLMQHLSMERFEEEREAIVLAKEIAQKKHQNELLQKAELESAFSEENAKVPGMFGIPGLRPGKSFLSGHGALALHVGSDLGGLNLSKANLGRQLEHMRTNIDMQQQQLEDGNATKASEDPLHSGRSATKTKEEKQRERDEQEAAANEQTLETFLYYKKEKEKEHAAKMEQLKQLKEIQQEYETRKTNKALAKGPIPPWLSEKQGDETCPVCGKPVKKVADKYASDITPTPMLCMDWSEDEAHAACFELMMSKRMHLLESDARGERPDLFQTSI